HAAGRRCVPKAPGGSGRQDGCRLHPARCARPAAALETVLPMSRDSSPARFAWLPPGLRPPAAMTWRQERVFLLVGVAALFAGYDLNIYGLAIPQIQASLHIPENQIGLTVSYFRLAALVALVLCA